MVNAPPSKKKRPFYRDWARGFIMARNEAKRQREIDRRRREDAHERALPSFLIAGVQKGGTTSLFDYLAQHPSVIPPIQKETYFTYTYHDDPDRAFRSFFPLQSELNELAKQTGGPTMTGEATPETMFTARTATRAHHAAPDAKIVALIREPIARAYSHHKHNMRHKLETVADFDRAIDLEAERTEAALARFESDERGVFDRTLNDQTYMVRGRYAEQVERLYNLWGRDKVLVIASERFFAETPTVYAEILAFLGLPPHDANLKAKNVNTYDPIKPETRERLQPTVGPWNAKLNEVLGRDIGW